MPVRNFVEPRTPLRSMVAPAFALFVLFVASSSMSTGTLAAKEPPSKGKNGQSEKSATAAQPAWDQWKAAVATRVITPEKPMWMAGYAGRTKPAETKVHDLFAKVLVIEDAAGTRLVFITTDLISVQPKTREKLAAMLHKEFKLPLESLWMNCSHTHCGPELRASKGGSVLEGAARTAQAHEYTLLLEKKLESALREAFGKLAPAKLLYGHARAGFSMNRRLPTPGGFQNSPYPDGPVDQAVPTLQVLDPDGKLKAVLFGYACHNTTLGFYQWCGDYAGFAQEYLEASHPGVTALFMLGCGGDQNPYPRGTVELAKQHGRTLATAVEAALIARTQPVRGPLKIAFEEVAIDFAKIPTRAELEERLKKTSGYPRQNAEKLLAQLDAMGKIPSQYPFPVQVVRFGDSLTMIGLGGETVVDFSLRLKRELRGATPVWVGGYSNDVMAYVPSLKVLKEGGYEGDSSMIYTGFPSQWAETVEERIIAKTHELLRRVGVAKQGTSKKSP